MEIHIPAGECLEVRGHDDPDPYDIELDGPCTVTAEWVDDAFGVECLLIEGTYTATDEIPDEWLTQPQDTAQHS